MRSVRLLVLILAVLQAVSAQQTDVLSPVWTQPLMPSVDDNVIVVGAWVKDIDADGRGEAVVVLSGPRIFRMVGDVKNHVSVFSVNGSVLWEIEVDERISSAALFDVDNDGRLELVVASGEELNNIQRGTVRVMGSEGRTLRKYDSSAVMGSMYVGDMEEDRYYEIVGGSKQRIFLFRSYGENIWMYPPRGEGVLNVSTDAVYIYDVDKNGVGDVIAGSDALYYIDASGKLMGKIDVEPNVDIRKRGFKFVSAAKGVNSNYPTTIAVTDSDKIVAVGIDKAEGVGYTSPTGQKRTATTLDLSVKWTLDLKCSVRDAILANLDGDDAMETLVACANNKVYAVDNNGLVLWDYPLDGEPNDISLEDVDGDRMEDILVAVSSGSIYLLDASGDFKWRYNTGSPLMVVSAGNMLEDGTKGIIAVSEDYKAKAYIVNETYTVRRRADTLFNLGQEAFISSDTTGAIEYFKEAKALYLRLGYERGVQESQSFIFRMETNMLEERRREADIYYSKAQELFFSEDYTSSQSFVNKAQAIYSEFGNQEGVVKCELLKLQIEKRLGDVGGTIPYRPSTSTTLPAADGVMNMQNYLLLSVLLIVLLALYLRRRSSGGRQQVLDEPFEMPKPEEGI
ncbi:MAG: VCBS repeat-containing protein [Candidatus Altiarchaeota archaeon]